MYTLKMILYTTFIQKCLSWSFEDTTDVDACMLFQTTVVLKKKHWIKWFKLKGQKANVSNKSVYY